MAPDTQPHPCPNCGYWRYSQNTTAYYTNEPITTLYYGSSGNSISAAVESFGRAVETDKARRLRVSRERTELAIQAARLAPTPAMPEKLFDRPRRVGRACGSRHRVMLC